MPGNAWKSPIEAAGSGLDTEAALAALIGRIQDWPRPGGEPPGAARMTARLILDATKAGHAVGSTL